MHRAAPALLLLVGSLAACAPLSRLRFERPTARLATVEVTGLGLQGGSLDLLVDVHNPNGYELRTTRLGVGIALEGTHFGDVAVTRAVALPARETTTVRLPLSFTWEGLGAGARALLARGAVRYRLTGRMDVDTPVGARGVELASDGDVTLREMLGR